MRVYNKVERARSSFNSFKRSITSDSYSNTLCLIRRWFVVYLEVTLWTVRRWVVVYRAVSIWTVRRWVDVYLVVPLWTVSQGCTLFPYAELEFLRWQFTMVFEKIVPIVWEFVCCPCGCCCKISIKEDVELWRNIYRFEIQNQSNTSCMMRRFIKMNGLYWSRCPFWNIFLLTNFGIEDEARRSKSMKFFTLACPLVQNKRSNAVIPESSGQLLPTSIANFIAYGHNSVVITSVQ